MKGLILILMILLPAAVIAQENDSSRMKEQPEAASSVQKESSATRNEGGVSFEPNRTASTRFAFALGSNAPPPQKGKASQSGKPKETPRPPIEGSMVGYIDNPIVGSQIRIRFDAAFDDEFPDRAEFFYAKCACYRHLQGAPSPVNQAFDPNAPGPGPGVPNAINFQRLYLHAEYSPHRRFSVFVEVPVRWLQPQGFQPIPPLAGFSNQSGLSDVQAGFKLAAVASEGTSLTFQFRSYFPSGDASRGLGTNHYSIEPSLLLYRNLSSRFTLEGQVGDWHPIGGSAGVPITASEGFAGDVFFYGIGPSYKLYRGNRVGVAPVVELFGWHVLGGFQTQPVTGTTDGAASEVSGLNIVNLKFGVRTSVGFHNSFYIGFGQALTHDDWYKHIVRVEYRYSF
jgi:hypothetical protein